jgi:hypothetical protein
MIAAPKDLTRRLGYILHLGFVEIRKLAQPAYCEQVADLADAMELLPRFLERATDEDFKLIRSTLRTYQEKHPHSTFDYLAYLDGECPPETY